MAKSVSFYNPTEQSIERKRRMAEAIMKQGQQPQQTEMVSGLAVPQSKLAGFAKALQQGIGGYMGGQADREEAAKAKAAQDTMAQALGLYNRSQAGGETQLQNGETIGWNKADPSQAAQIYQNILMGNPDTAPMGMQAAMGQMQAQQNMANDLEMFKQKMPLELDMARQKAQIDAQYGGSEGGDTGVLLNRLIEANRALGNVDYNINDALRDLKGGAGAQGRLGAEIELGRQAEMEKQTGQNISDLEYKPQIANETAQQTEIGKREGEAAATLQFLEANMPKLEQVTKDLSTLGKTATYTKMGQGKDVLTREIGAPVGQGAIDRTAYIAKVDNEVLPLLRDTFGSAFTVQEGNSLRATLGNPNISPPEKDAVLNAFISQKKSQVEALKRQVGPQGQGSNPAITTPYQDIKPAIVNWEDLP